MFLQFLMLCEEEETGLLDYDFLYEFVYFDKLRAALFTFEGCDSGFGNALARRLDQLGVKVFAGCLFPDGDGAKRLKEETRDVMVLQLNVTKDSDVRDARATIQRELENDGT